MQLIGGTSHHEKLVVTGSFKTYWFDSHFVSDFPVGHKLNVYI